MDSYHYINQKTDLVTEKSFIKMNKNIQFQNFFRGDSNLNKPKGRIYNLNTKKGVHLTSRVKDNEIGGNGPKMLTLNFPPGFMYTDANNNPANRKTVSHDKNKYLKQNLSNNMELNDIGLDTQKIFSNTSKKGFQNASSSKTKDENNPCDKKKKIVTIKFSHNSNSEKEKIDYSGSPDNGYILNGNNEYIKSESESKSKRNNSFKENVEKISMNNYRDFRTNENNYISNSNINKNKSYNIYLKNQPNTKNSLNILYTPINIENNNYNYNNSTKTKTKKYSYVKKNIYSKNNPNKLVFNPSSITNQRMIRKCSDSDLCSSSINPLYLGNKKYNKNIKELNNHLSYSNLNENFYKKINNHIFYNYNESEVQDKHSSSQNKEKNIRTKTDFDTNVKSNYYQSLIYELENRFNNESKWDLNKDKNNNKIENLNIGITYKVYNGYKYYFNIPNAQVYLLKEVNYSIGKSMMDIVDEWNKKNENEEIYLKIYHREINSNQRQIMWVIQYPTGGESLNDLINSVGFYDENFLFNLINKLYKIIKKIKDDKCTNCDKFQNIPFCLCDIFININEHIKIIPPLMRQIPINSEIKKNENYSQTHPCKCKTNIFLLKILFNIQKESMSYFCLGFLILQIITQNLIFEMNSFKFLFKKLKTNLNNKINLNKIINNNKNNINCSDKKCCLVHLLLNIEKQKLNSNEYLLLSQFLKLYPKSLLTFLHECTSFKSTTKPSLTSEFLNLYNTNKNLNLTIKEILSITLLPKNDYIKFETFLGDFEMLYKDAKIEPENYVKKLNNNKILYVLSRAFEIDKDKLLNQLTQKMDCKSNRLNNGKEDDNENKDLEYIQNVNSLIFGTNPNNE